MRQSSRANQSRLLRRVAALLCVVLALPAGGCVYRINIQQGNYLDPAALEQLQVGMTRSQVRYLLGTPMVPDAFDKDRWDYLFYFKRGRLRDPEERKVIVYFGEDDRVTRFDRGTGPSSQVATAESADPQKELPPKEPPPKEPPQTEPSRSEPLAQEPPN
jgi:outer membrane protein assembly factor BamE